MKAMVCFEKMLRIGVQSPHLPLHYTNKEHAAECNQPLLEQLACT
jgi:hypothetical protein